MKNDFADLELNQAEIFLRAILAFSDEQASNGMWQECHRHEWADWIWDAQAPTKEGPGAIVPRARRLSVKRIEDLV